MMDSIEALEKVNDSISRGASALDFSPSDITGDCAAQVQEIVRLRKSGIVTEDSLNKALLCLNDGNGLIYLGLIAAGFGHWNCSIKAYEKAQSIFTKLGDVQGAAQTYGNLGLVYADMGEWSKAIEFYQKILETFEKHGDVQGAA
ncbi:MAG: tetratricopeptide repeat protein, partial [Candidatus Methanoperedens sp.]